jgi:hypothetical protein
VYRGVKSIASLWKIAPSAMPRANNSSTVGLYSLGAQISVDTQTLVPKISVNTLDIIATWNIKMFIKFSQANINCIGKF